jgi:tRNA threonylcarbamoyladenosine biosynthesis protein TsaE
LEPGSVVLLCGELGAGKTQLTKGIAAALGVTEPITSPTFNIMFEHLGGASDSGTNGNNNGNNSSNAFGTSSEVVLRHFDLYRLDDESELDDIDYFGLLEDAAVSVVEWGDKFADALPADYLKVEFSYGESPGDASARTLCFSAVGAKSEQLLEALENTLAEPQDVK